jgi:hypothetical protein
MLSFHTQDELISEKEFAGTPSAHDMIVSVQSVSSTQDRSTNGTSKASSHRGDSLREGDLITGFVDITNERVYMVPGIGSEDRAGEKQEMVRTCSHPVGHLTHPTPLGGIHHLLANYPARISGWVEPGPPFQRNLAYAPSHLSSVITSNEAPTSSVPLLPLPP